MISLDAKNPVINGPTLVENVLTTFKIPMTAVRSFGSITAAKKAERGATSIDCVHDRRTRKVKASGRDLGTGMNESAIAEGRWVNTMVWRVDVSSLKFGVGGGGLRNSP